MVYQAANAVKLPVIGMGGIVYRARTPWSLFWQAPRLYQWGRQTSTNPYATMEIAEGIVNYMKENGVEEIQELIGAVK